MCRELVEKEGMMQAVGGCLGHRRKFYFLAVHTVRVTECTNHIFAFVLKSCSEGKPFDIATG